MLMGLKSGRLWYRIQRGQMVYAGSGHTSAYTETTPIGRLPQYDYFISVSLLGQLAATLEIRPFATLPIAALAPLFVTLLE